MKFTKGFALSVLIITFFMMLFVTVLASEVSATVVIHQVLYDPMQETGSEAVELYNDADTQIDISNWTIGTESSQTDARIPRGVVLQPHQFYLVADANWSVKKDIDTWSNADYEEAITLRNTNGGVFLNSSSGELIDSVGWGTSNYAKKSPAMTVKEGHSITRMKQTENSSLDFVETSPVWTGMNATLLIIDVLPQAALEIIIPDDVTSLNGTQLLPIRNSVRQLTIRATSQVQPIVQFLNTTISLEQEGNTSTNNWTGTVELPYWQKPGNYSFSLIAGDNTLSKTVEVFSLAAWDVQPRKVRVTTDMHERATITLDVKNTGNIPLTLTSTIDGLRSMLSSLSATSDTTQVSINPTQKKTVTIQTAIPTIPGTYMGSVQFTRIE